MTLNIKLKSVIDRVYRCKIERKAGRKLTGWLNIASREFLCVCADIDNITKNAGKYSQNAGKYSQNAANTFVTKTDRNASRREGCLNMDLIFPKIGT